MKSLLALFIVAFVISAPVAYARGGGGGHSSGGHSGGKSSSSHSYSSGSTRGVSPGTGAKSQSTTVHGYTKRDGTHVNSYKRSTADKNFNNNWSTKGNANPVTGKKGTKTEPPKPH